MSVPQLSRVLLVEDDWFLAQETAEASQNVGLHVVGPFRDCAEATAALEIQTIDAALLDAGEQSDDTFALARKLRETGVPVVLHTVWSTAEIPNDLANISMVPPWKGTAASVAALFECPHSHFTKSL